MNKVDYIMIFMIFMIKNTGSLGIAVIVTPAVALLAGGSATIAGTGGSSGQLVKTQNTAVIYAFKTVTLTATRSARSTGLVTARGFEGSLVGFL
ncbi:MAG TPA: hypothetical protein PLA27_11945 [Anaerolineales bacterium]|nr:hypothetical protein [Anaerolineales bacterium]HQX17128.1 hypothetical protein [Anaerolineales bacterium]